MIIRVLEHNKDGSEAEFFKDFLDFTLKDF